LRTKHGDVLTEDILALIAKNAPGLVIPITDTAIRVGGDHRKVADAIKEMTRHTFNPLDHLSMSEKKTISTRRATKNSDGESEAAVLQP